MKVPERIIQLVSAYRTHGDVQNILNENPDLKRYEINQVINNENSTPEAIAAVAKYYKGKEEILSDYLTD